MNTLIRRNSTGMDVSLNDDWGTGSGPPHAPIISRRHIDPSIPILLLEAESAVTSIDDSSK